MRKLLDIKRKKKLNRKSDWLREKIAVIRMQLERAPSNFGSLSDKHHLSLPTPNFISKSQREKDFTIQQKAIDTRERVNTTPQASKEYSIKFHFVVKLAFKFRFP